MEQAERKGNGCRSHARASRQPRWCRKAWPYEEARKLLKRYPDGPGERGDRLRDRLRAVGPAASRHLPGGGADPDGPPRARRDGRLAEPADRFLRRHGRDAQGAARRAAPGHDARASRPAAVQGARPVRLRP